MLERPKILKSGRVRPHSLQEAFAKIQEFKKRLEEAQSNEKSPGFRQKELLQRAISVILPKPHVDQNTQIDYAQRLRSLGNAHGALGNFDQMQTTLEEALRIFKQHCKADDAEVAFTSIELSNAYRFQGESTKEKEMLDDAERILSFHAKLCFALRFTLKETAAVLDYGAGDISYYGGIEPVAENCYISFPGKFTAGWHALTKQLKGDSVACVFLCTKEDGLGVHHKDPDYEDGRCYCPKIYGKRDYERFGYLRKVGPPYDDEKMRKAQEKADDTNAVLLREDATPEEVKRAEAEAKKRWEKSSYVATWGCEWYYAWRKKVEEAVRLKQKLKVVFFPNQVGQGILTMEQLQDENADPWDGIGCGGSQKSEIATVEEMRKTVKDGSWDYEGVDVCKFLNDTFQIGDAVDAKNESKWRRGRVINTESTAKGVRWTVRSAQHPFEDFDTEHVRHVDVAMEKLEKKKGFDLIEMLGDCLPDGQEVLSVPKVHRLQNGTSVMSVQLRSKSIEAMQKLRDRVLSGDLDLDLNQSFLKKHPHDNWQLQIEKTEFVKSYRKTLFSRTELTAHQNEVLKELKPGTDFHVKAAAGTGKTFLAVQKVLDTLAANQGGLVLFVAPQQALCLHFLRWLAVMKAGHLDVESARAAILDQLCRIRLMHDPYDCFKKVFVESNRLVLAEDAEVKDQFLLAVVDESHNIYRSDIEQGLLNEKFPAKQWILLSDKSQSSAVENHFPQFHRVSLTEVVRSTKRIVLGAAAFQVSEGERNSSSSSEGPPLRSYIFEAKEKAFPPYQDYSTHVVIAMWDLIRAYPGLSFHQSLALIVPDDSFRDEFQPILQEALEKEISSKRFRLVTFEESLSSVLLGVEDEPTENIECIVVDSMNNARGLEQLFVMAIGMDAEIDSPGTSDLDTRANLYQSITRAQLMAMVVNHFVPGGWLEHLTLLELREDVFTEEVGQGEVSSDAAAEVVKAAAEATKQPSAKPNKSTSNKTATEGSTATGDTTQTSEHASASLREPMTTKKSHKSSSASAGTVDNAEFQGANEPSTAAGDTTAVVKPQTTSSSVWDSSRSMKTSNAKLRFDPRVSGIPDGLFKRLQSLPGSVEPPDGCPHNPQDCVFLTREEKEGGYIVDTSTTDVFFFHRSGKFLRKCYHERSEDENILNETEKTLEMWEGHLVCQPDKVICQCRQASESFNKSSIGGKVENMHHSPLTIDSSGELSYTLDDLERMFRVRQSGTSIFYGSERVDIPTGELSELGFNPKNQWFWERPRHWK
eukprot:Skav204370  [mRNA]  locus=scaffold866:161073:167523:+ [translate_table: standard]